LPPTLNQKKQSTQTDRQTRLVVSSSQINPVGALSLEEANRVRAGTGAHRWSTPASQRAKVVPPAAAAAAAAAAARKERKRGRRLLVVEEAAGVGCGWVESGRRREEKGRSARRGRESRRREAAAMAVWPRC
jgi:hypothetical protein